jgi:hypothetical protein
MGSFGHIAGADVTVVKTSTEGAEFPQGAKTEVVNSDRTTATYVYVRAGSALTKGKVYRLDNGYECNAGVAADTSLGYHACIPQVAIASGGYGWAAIDGHVDHISVLSAAAAATSLYTSATAGALDDTSGSQARLEGQVVLDSVATSASTFPGTIVGPLKVSRTAS